MKLRTLALLTTLALAGCGVTTKPPSLPDPPPTLPATKAFTLAAHVRPGGTPVADCAVKVTLQLSGEFTGTTNADGYVALQAHIPDPDPGGGLNARSVIECPGFVRFEDSFVIAGENQDLTFGGAVAVGNHPLLRAGPKPVPPVVSGGEHGRIHVEGTAFVREDGSKYAWRGLDGFLDLAMLRIGADLQPLINDRIIDSRTKVRRPANLFRVFATLDWRNQHDDRKFAAFGGNGPRIAPDDPAYYTDLVKLVEWNWARGFRLELSFGDLVKIFPTHEARVAFFHTIGAALQTHTESIFGEINEPECSDEQVCPDEAQELTQILHSYGWLVSNGVYEWPVGTTSAPHGDYGTRHGSRGEDWPRDVRGAAEVQSGFTWADGSVFPGLHIPMVEDEQMGAAEVSVPGRRSADCDDHAQAAAGAALFIGNYTFHSDNGTYSQIFEPKQGDCATAALTAAAAIPVEAQFAAYQRGAAGDAGGGFGPGVGDMPIAHFDLEEAGRSPRHLRAFCKLVEPFEYCVAIRTQVEHETPRPGWAIDVEYRKGIVRLKRAGVLSIQFNVPRQPLFSPFVQ